MMCSYERYEFYEYIVYQIRMIHAIMWFIWLIMVNGSSCLTYPRLSRNQARSWGVRRSRETEEDARGSAPLCVLTKDACAVVVRCGLLALRNYEHPVRAGSRRGSERVTRASVWRAQPGGGRRAPRIPAPLRRRKAAASLRNGRWQT